MFTCPSDPPVAKVLYPQWKLKQNLMVNKKQIYKLYDFVDT